MTTKKVKVTNIFDKTIASEKFVILNVGGAGSSKSHSIAQLLIQKLVNEQNKTIGIGRKTFPALRMTAYKLVIGLLQEYGIYRLENHNKTEHTYRHGSSLLQFFSLDDPEKIKSANFNYLWLEETNEFTYDDYLVLKMRLRAPTTTEEPNCIYLTLNPVDENCWVAQKIANDPNVEVIHSTYHDNPFLSRAYTDMLENLINEDTNYYRIYVLGEWGKLENLIYKSYQIVPTMPVEFERVAYGLDFGYINPTVLLKIGLIGKEAYIEERIYETHLTNADLIELLKHEERLDIYADSAEPQRIEEIARVGFNVYPANKDVKLGIDTCKRYKLNILQTSINTIKEIRGYQRKVNKDGIVLEEPVKFNDHSMDTMRYCLMGMAQPEEQESVVIYDALSEVERELAI